MNSSRYSELGAVLAVVTLLAVAAVPVAAVSVDGDAPGTAQVGEQQSTTFEVTEPFSDYEEWTLRAQTDLTEVTWQVTTFDNAGNQVNEETLTGQEMTYQLQASSGVTRVAVGSEGTVPDASTFEWSYDPAQTLTYASFEQTQEGGSTNAIGESFEFRPYTSESQEARTAINAAGDAIDSAQSGGASVSGAEGDLEDAVEFYSTGNFEQAVGNAEEAESTANSAASSAEQTQLLLYGGVALVVLLVLAGGVYWYLQQR